MGPILNGKDFIGSHFRKSTGEVFYTPLLGKSLVGRGQHCNLSIYFGNTNLFFPIPKRLLHRNPNSETNDLVNHAAAKALEWLPYMLLPCRAGNYYRIKANSPLAIHTFSGKDVTDALAGVNKSGYILRYTADQDVIGISKKPGTYRIEFRQGAAEADSYDLALASAAPLVKACEETLAMEHGEIKLNEKGRPIVITPRHFPTKKEYNAPVPKNEEEAKAAFNTPDNPYFTYLNELAERKIERAVKLQACEPSATHAQEVREAEELSGIGSRLYAVYCDKYHMENLMPSPQTHALVGR